MRLIIPYKLIHSDFKQVYFCIRKEIRTLIYILWKRLKKTRKFQTFY